MENYESNMGRYEAFDVNTPRKTTENLELFSPFGPFIVRRKCPQKICDLLESAITNQIPPDQSREWMIPNDLCSMGNPSLIHFLGTFTRDYFKVTGFGDVLEVQFQAIWGVQQQAGCYSPTHFHSTDVAGVMYLRTPVLENQENATPYMLNRQMGKINFISGGKMTLAKSVASFTPQAGDCYLFPGWLLHVAEPFQGTGVRISVAFNLEVKSG